MTERVITDSFGNVLDYNFVPGDLVRHMKGVWLGIVVTVDYETKFGECHVMCSQSGSAIIAKGPIFALKKIK